MTHRRMGDGPGHVDATPAQVPKDLRSMVRAALDDGWRLTRGGKHVKLTAPDGYSIPMPSSTRGKAGGLVKAIERELRKRGVAC